MKHIPPFSSIIFDMDGVITNTMPYHYEAWRRVFLLKDLHVNEYDVYKREGQAGTGTVHDIFRDYGRSISELTARGLLSRKEHLFKKIVRVRFVVGARSFLKDARRRGYRLALVTGTSRHEMEKILPCAIRALFEDIVTGTDVRNGKPHPEPFLKAVKRLGIHSRDAVVIENAPFGIASAKSAKLFCIALETSLPRKFLTEADIVAHSYKSVRRALFS